MAAEWQTLDDTALLCALRDLYAPGAPEPDVTRLTAELRGRLVDVPVPGGAVKLDLGDWTAILTIRLGAWEPHLGRLARALVRPGDVAVDVGAHAGAWTLLLASLVGERGRVLAYEPFPPSAARARAAVGGRAEVIEAAVGEREGRGSLRPGSDSMLCALAPDGTIDVRVTALDAAPVERVDFLKIDTEGAELAVLRGARALVARSPDPRLLVELHADELAANRLGVADVLAELEAQGLAVWDIVPLGGALVSRRMAVGDRPTTHHVLARRGDEGFNVSLGP